MFCVKWDSQIRAWFPGRCRIGANTQVKQKCLSLQSRKGKIMAKRSYLDVTFLGRHHIQVVDGKARYAAR